MNPNDNAQQESASSAAGNKEKAAAAATMSSPWSSASASSEQSSCGQCRDLLLRVFQQSASRPHRLLASMANKGGSMEWRNSAQGIQVKIPTEGSRPAVPLHRRRWSRISPPQQQPVQHAAPQPNSLPLPVPLVQATSSSSAKEDSLIKSPSSEDALSDSAKRSGCSTPDSKQSNATASSATEWMNVSCETCPDVGPKGKARAYVNGPQPLDIVICANRLRDFSRQEMEEIVLHELMHVYDARHLQLDLRDCENLAYSEVRAAREAECSGGNRHHLYSAYTGSAASSAQVARKCVQDRALLATQNLFPLSTSRQCVQRVFETAMNDARPFHQTETPQQRQQTWRNKPAASTTSQR